MSEAAHRQQAHRLHSLPRESTIGGITPLKKPCCLQRERTVVCAPHGIGPGDISPVGACANMYFGFEFTELWHSGIHANERRAA